MRVCLVLEENAKLSSRVAVPFCDPLSKEREFLSLHNLTSVWWWQCPSFGHCNRHDGVSHCCFICISLMMYGWGLFSYYYLPSVYLFCHRCLFKSFAHFPIRSFIFFFFFRVTPAAYGGFQAKGQICSHWPTPQPEQHRI